MKEHYAKKRIENYIDNMKWENIPYESLRDTMLSIISQYQRGVFITKKQVNALENTCIRSNRGIRPGPSSWRVLGKSGSPIG